MHTAIVFFVWFPPPPLRILASFLAFMGPGRDLDPPCAAIILYGYFGHVKILRTCHAECKIPIRRVGAFSRSLVNRFQQNKTTEA